jgi:hypothetical protein
LQRSRIKALDNKTFRISKLPRILRILTEINLHGETLACRRLIHSKFYEILVLSWDLNIKSKRSWTLNFKIPELLTRS